jgi:hypothetical protein
VKQSNLFGSPTTSYSLLNKRVLEEDEVKSTIRRSDIRGIEIEDSPHKPEITKPDGNSVNSNSSLTKSRDDKLFDIANQIGNCFPGESEKLKEDEVAHLVSPISSVCNASAEKQRMNPEIEANEFGFSPVKDTEICITGEASDTSILTPQPYLLESPGKVPEIEVEEVCPVIVESEALKSDEKQEINDFIKTETNNLAESPKSESSVDIENDRNAQAEFLTDEVLSMMIYSDIHDNAMHPFRDQ